MAESNALIPSFTTPMGMEAFHCDDFELRVWFESGEMDSKAFLRTVAERGQSITPNKDGDIDVAFTFGGGTPSVNYHAHLKVRLRKDGSGKVDLNYHSSPLKDALDELPPYVEDCAQWLADFFSEKVQAHLHVNYTFDKSFVPVVNLPFPLTTSETALAGALVSGIALILPGSETRTAIIQSIGNGTHIFLRETTAIDLRNFNLLDELDKLSVLINTLMKRQVTDEIGSAKRK